MNATGPRKLVLDASVALKWVIPEPNQAEAVRLRTAYETGAVRVHVPELWFAEVGNALWARTRRELPHKLMRREAAMALGELSALELRRHSLRQLTALALVLACDAAITVYDATYLALAVRETALLVTADDRLIADAEKIGLGDHVVALRDVGTILEPPAEPL